MLALGCRVLLLLLAGARPAHAKAVPSAAAGSAAAAVGQPKAQRANVDGGDLYGRVPPAVGARPLPLPDADGGLGTGADPVGRAPSCGGCARRESTLAHTLRLNTYTKLFATLGPANLILIGSALLLALGLVMRKLLSADMMQTLLYTTLYLTASPTAIILNKMLMKDLGFGYPCAPPPAQLAFGAPRPSPPPAQLAFGAPRPSPSPTAAAIAPSPP